MRKGFIAVVLIILALVFGFGYFWLTRPAMSGGMFYETKQALCSAAKGEMKETGCGITGCAFGCVFPYRDAGKSCQSSSDCSGKCIVVKPSIGDFLIIGKQPDMTPDALSKCKRIQGLTYDCKGLNFEAACQKWPLENCQRNWEYNKGAVSALDGQCNI